MFRFESNETVMVECIARHFDRPIHTVSLVFTLDKLHDASIFYSKNMTPRFFLGGGGRNEWCHVAYYVDYLSMRLFDKNSFHRELFVNMVRHMSAKEDCFDHGAIVMRIDKDMWDRMKKRCSRVRYFKSHDIFWTRGSQFYVKTFPKTDVIGAGNTRNIRVVKQSIKMYCFHVDNRMYVFLKYESSRPYSIKHIRSSLRNRILHHTFSRRNSANSPRDRRESQCTRNHLQSIQKLSGSNRKDALTWYTRDRYTLLGGLPCSTKTASECCKINQSMCGDEYFVGYASAKKLLQRSQGG